MTYRKQAQLALSPAPPGLCAGTLTRDDPTPGPLLFSLSIEVQGLGPWRGWGSAPTLLCFLGQWFGRRV
jgi:hypothetical protein